MNVTTNDTQRLYVIPSGNGYSCLGFDVCKKRAAAYAEWLGMPAPTDDPGSIELYNAYRELTEAIRLTGEQCPAQLTPELIGLEGSRVEVTYPDGERHRFYVGKSTGWIPVHLEIARRNSSGGPAVYFPEGATVRVIRHA